MSEKKETTTPVKPLFFIMTSCAVFGSLLHLANHGYLGTGPVPSWFEFLLTYPITISGTAYSILFVGYLVYYGKKNR